MEELISVIIPVWKPHFEQLKICIESIVNQTYKNLEIIISYRNENAFDEKFFRMINEFNDSRIKIILNKKKGFTNALNEAVVYASGKYIARMDADDSCKVDRIEKQIEFKKHHDYDIVGTWGKIISEEGKIIGSIQVPISNTEIRKKIILHNPILHPSVLMDKKIFEDIGLYDTSFAHAEDYELWTRAIKNNLQIGNIPEYLTSIREAKNSRTRGEEWREHRKYNIKVKSKAINQYGFRKPTDIFYYVISLFSYFVSPKYALTAKKITGWYK